MPVQADAVDDTSFGPVHSFLAPGPNAAAQALLSDPTLRGRSAEQLARLVHVSVSDARCAIAAVIGMINAIAQGSPNTALSRNPSLEHAVGPYMSLDQAMSRFGSHMGPVVSSPRPASILAQSDAPPDRQYGAGSLEYIEAGDIPADVHDAAVTMVSFLEQNGCGVSPGGVVSHFQAAYNADFAQGALTVDDKYGPQTEGALKDVIAASPASSDLSGVTVPPSCYGASGPGTYVVPLTVISPTGTVVGPAPIAPAPAPAPTPSSHRVAQASMFSSSWTLAGLAVLVAAAAISQSKHPPKWARKLGLHR